MVSFLMKAIHYVLATEGTRRRGGAGRSEGCQRSTDGISLFLHRSGKKLQNPKENEENKKTETKLMTELING